MGAIVPNVSRNVGTGHTAWNDKQRHQSMVRARQVMDLRMDESMSFRDIGEQLGISHTTARKLWLKAMDQAKAELAEEAKRAVAIELTRLDRLWALNFKRATDDRIDTPEQQAATDRCLKIVEARRKLLGLDAPDRLELTGAEGGPIIFQDVMALSGEALESELAGFFQPGYMEGAADGYAAAQAERAERPPDALREARKDKAKAKAKAQVEAAQEAEPPKRTVPVVQVSQGRARV